MGLIHSQNTHNFYNISITLKNHNEFKDTIVSSNEYIIILIPNEYLLKIKCILIIDTENIEEYRIGFELIKKGVTLLLIESFNHATFHI